MQCIIMCDVDGVLTAPQKMFRCTNKSGSLGEDRWSKIYSDRDSWALQRLKNEIVFISHDRRNEHYIHYKGHKFLYVPHPLEKYDAIIEYWNNFVTNNTVEGEKDKPIYIYLGDDVFDYKALSGALYGFIPSDANMILKDKIFKDGKLVGAIHSNKIMQLQSAGGAGCINEAMYRLYLSGCYKDKNSVLHDYDIFNKIDEYFKI